MNEPCFPKTNKKRYTGSVIGIPVGESLVQTLVLWHSNHFKNVILLAPTDRLVPFQTETTEFGTPISLLFGGAKGIRAGYWKYQGQVDINVPPIVYTFISAQHIYKGDEMIGIAGSRERLMNLSVGGRLFVEREIAELLCGRTSPIHQEEHKIAKDIICKHLNNLTSSARQPN
jgi:hypothetical protein